MAKKISTPAGSMSLQKSSIAQPGEDSRLQVTILSNLIDRWEGMSATLDVWSDKPNMQYITRACADENVRERVARFFVSREMVAVLNHALRGLRSIKVGDVVLTKEMLHSSVLAATDVSPTAAGVVLELILPALLEKQLVNSNLKYSRHVQYPFQRVEVQDIMMDVAMHQVGEAAAAAKASGIVVGTKYSLAPFCEALAESFRPVGLAMLDINELSPIMDDLIKGVRAHIDPMHTAGGVRGSTPAEWRNHRVVAELAQNLPFVRAALSLPPDTQMGITSETWRLEKWAPIILASIKSSIRYAWIGKQEALRHYSLSKVRNTQGRPVSCVLARSAKVQPVAQAVFAVKDAMMPSAYNINATKDRIADAIQIAYGAATFSTDRPADLLHSVLTDAAEAGWGHMKAVYFVDTLGNGSTAADIAVLLATRMYVEIGDEGVVVADPTLAGMIEDDDTLTRVWNPKWWYVVPTTEKNLVVWSGTHFGSEVVTTDPAEALLAHDEFMATESIPARPQVLGPSAFNTRVVDFDDRLLQAVNHRFPFNITVNDVTLRGTLRAIDFASLRSGFHTAIVLPHFNSEVVSGSCNGYMMAQQVLKSMAAGKTEGEESFAWESGQVPSSAFFDLMNRRVASDLLKLAQNLAPSFRQEVHTAIVERSLIQEGVTPDQAIVMRARMNQKTFAACADVVALYFFLHLQGMDADRWAAIVDAETLVRVCMEVGSDR